jgi:hypothetical protein
MRNLGTISAFAYRHRETEKNLCRGGRSQDLPDTDLSYCLFCFYICSYSLTSSAFLNVDPTTGSVTVNAEIFYGRQQQVFATVRAVDTAEPPHFDFAQIVVNVTDINDMRPLLFMVRVVHNSGQQQDN